MGHVYSLLSARRLIRRARRLEQLGTAIAGLGLAGWVAATVSAAVGLAPDWAAIVPMAAFFVGQGLRVRAARLWRG